MYPFRCRWSRRSVIAVAITIVNIPYLEAGGWGLSGAATYSILLYPTLSYSILLYPTLLYYDPRKLNSTSILLRTGYFYLRAILLHSLCPGLQKNPDG